MAVWIQSATLLANELERNEPSSGDLHALVKSLSADLPTQFLQVLNRLAVDDPHAVRFADRVRKIKQECTGVPGQRDLRQMRLVARVKQIIDRREQRTALMRPMQTAANLLHDALRTNQLALLFARLPKETRSQIVDLLKWLVTEAPSITSSMCIPGTAVDATCDRSSRTATNDLPSDASEGAASKGGDGVFKRRKSKSSSGTDRCDPDEVETKNRSNEILWILTDGASAPKLQHINAIVLDPHLKVDEKLWNWHEILPIPPTASKRNLAKCLGVTPTAIQNTSYWKENRLGQRKRSARKRYERNRDAWEEGRNR